MSDGKGRPFRFSVQAFEAESGRQWTDLARRAEDLGYSTLFTTDHYFGPGDIAEASGHRPVDVAPLTAMTAAAMATTQPWVGYGDQILRWVVCGPAPDGLPPHAVGR